MGPIEPRIYCSHLEYNYPRIQIDNMPSSSSIDDSVDWNKSISSILESSEIKQVKKLRKMVLLSLQLDESDKSSKKLFKKAIQNMEESGKVKLEADGTISLIKAKINKKKRKSSSTNEEDEGKSKKKRKSKRQTTKHLKSMMIKIVGTIVKMLPMQSPWRMEGKKHKTKTLPLRIKAKLVHLRHPKRICRARVIPKALLVSSLVTSHFP